MGKTYGPLSVFSMVASLASIVFLIWFFVQPFEAPWTFVAMAVASSIGAVTGFVSRRNGPHITNIIGLYLGILMILVFVFLIFYLTTSKIEVTRPL